MELAIPRDGDGHDFSKVMKYFRDKDGLPIFRSHNNPILDTRLYNVEYKYKNKVLLMTNVTAENMFTQVNGGGNWHVLFQDIVDYRYDVTEVNEKDMFIMTRTGTKRCRDMTKGFEVLVR